MRIGMILDNEINDDIRVQNEIRVLNQSGHKIILLCKGKKGNSQVETTENLIIHRLFFSKKTWGLLMIFSQTIPVFYFIWNFHFKKLAKRYQFDAIHVHDLFMYYAAKKTAKQINKPLVLDLHENYPETIKSYTWTKSWYVKFFYSIDYWSRKELNILNSVDKFIVLSEDFKNNLCLKYPTLDRNKIIKYSNVPDLSFFDSMSIDSNILEKENSFVVFYFGVIARRRGIYTLIEAVSKLKKDNTDIKLLLIGPVDSAEQNDFNTFIDDSNLKDFLIYYPWKDISLLPSYISVSDACVSPLVKNDQHESGVANKIFQYMYFKRPIIVSDCKPQADIAIDNKCGIVFKSENIEDLVQKIKILINNRSLINVLGENGHKAVINKYNTSIEGQNVVEMYNEISTF